MWGLLFVICLYYLFHALLGLIAMYCHVVSYFAITKQLIRYGWFSSLLCYLLSIFMCIVRLLCVNAIYHSIAILVVLMLFVLCFAKLGFVVVLLCAIYCFLFCYIKVVFCILFYSTTSKVCFAKLSCWVVMSIVVCSMCVQFVG